MNPNAAAEAGAVVSTIDPQTVANTPVVGDYVAAKNHQKILFYFLLGNMASETIDCAVYEYTDGSGSGGQAYKAATQLAAHASNNDNTQIVIEVDCSKLSTGFSHVAPRMVTGAGTGGPAAALGIAFGSRFEPATDGDLASVSSINRK